MILSDNSIKKLLQNGILAIYPLDLNDIQPSSVDLRLSNTFLEYDTQVPYVDVKQDISGLTKKFVTDDDKPYIIHPGQFVLGSTVEWVELPYDLVARLEGKSSLGRLGLIIHSTAGFVDPGWRGTLTLELSNISNLPIALYPNMRICQISFLSMTSPADRTYGNRDLRSRYQEQEGPVASRYTMN